MCKSRWSGGIYKDGGKGGKAVCGFPRLSTGRHFHGSFLCCFGSFLLSIESPSKAVRFGSGFQDVRPVGDTIQQCFAKASIRNHLRPFGKGKVRGQDHGPSLGTFGDDLKQKLSTYFCQRNIAHFVDGDQIIAAPASHYTPEL